MNLPELSIEYYYFLYGIVAGVLIAAVITLVVAIIWKLFSKLGRKDKAIAVKAESPPKITDMPLLEARAKEAEDKQKQKSAEAKIAQKQIREIMGDKPIVVISRGARGGNTHGKKG